MSNETSSYMSMIENNYPRKVSPTNTSLYPLPENRVDIRYSESTLAPEHEVNVYQRIVPPNTTLVGEEDGKFIESPEGSYVILVKMSISMF